MPNSNSYFDDAKFILPVICSEGSVKKEILSEIGDIEMVMIGCVLHDEELITKFKRLLIMFVINLFCKRVNNILSGKAELCAKPNHIEIAAFRFRHKKKGIGKFGQNIDD